MLEFYIRLIFLYILAVCYAVAVIFAVEIIKEWIEDLEFEMWRKRNYDKKINCPICRICCLLNWKDWMMKN